MELSDLLKPFVADVMGREVRQYLLGSLQCAWQCSGGVILAVAWQCGRSEERL